MSFTVDMHYCGDTLVDSAIFHKVKTCGMEMQKAVKTKTNAGHQDVPVDDVVIKKVLVSD